MKGVSVSRSLLACTTTFCCALSVWAEGENASLDAQAEKAIARKDFQAAYSFADQSIKLHPSAVGYMLRAKASIEENKFAEANKDATESINLNPKLHPAYIVRCMARKSLGDSKGSLEDAKKAAELDPTNMFWLSATAMMEYEGRDYKGSLEHYNQAIKILSPAIKTGAETTGAGKSGVAKPANGTANDLAASAPAEPDAKSQKRTEFTVSLFSGRAEANAMLGNFKDSLVDYNKAISLNAGVSKFFVNRGAVKDELGDHKGAIADYDAALKLKPDDAIAYKMRSESKNDLGDKVGAAADVEKATNLLK